MLLLIIIMIIIIIIIFYWENGYETTWKYSMIKELYKLRLRGKFPNFIKNFLLDPKFRVRIGSTQWNVHYQRRNSSGVCTVSDLLQPKINIPSAWNLKLMRTSVSPPDLNTGAHQSINCNNASRKSTNGQLQTAFRSPKVKLDACIFVS